MLKGSENSLKQHQATLAIPKKGSALPSSFSIFQCNILVSGMLSSLKPTTYPFEEIGPNCPKTKSGLHLPLITTFQGRRSLVSGFFFSTPPWQTGKTVSKLCASAACGNAGKFERSGITYIVYKYTYIHVASSCKHLVVYILITVNVHVAYIKMSYMCNRNIDVQGCNYITCILYTCKHVTGMRARTYDGMRH